MDDINSINHIVSGYLKLLIKRCSWCLIPVLLLSGCDQPNNDMLTTEETGKGLISLRFGHDMPTTSAQHKGAVRFAELVSEKSGGQITVDIFPDQILGNDHQMIALAQRGELDITLPPTAKLSILIPGMQLFDLPYLLPNVETAYRVLDSGVGKSLLGQLAEHGLVGVSFWESGFKQLTTNRSIERPQDFAEMTFRIMRSEVISDQFTAWGAKPLAVDFGMTHGALKENAVDGQENPLGSIYNMKFHEVQSHLYISDHGYLAQVLMFSAERFNALSEKFKNILLEAADEATAYQRAASREAEKIFINKIKQSDITIAQLPADVKQHLQERSQRVIEQHRATIGTGLIELARQSVDEGRVYRDDELVIGLDADIAGASSLSGLAIRRGIEIAMDEINRDGGVLGKKLVLTARDNSMVSARGIDNLERFSAIPNLVAVFGGISSPVALSELDIIHEKKIIYLDPWAAATPIVDNGRTPNFVFRVSVRDEYAAGFLLPEALKVSDKVGLLLVNNGWGRSNHRALIDELKQRSLEAVSIQWFDWGEMSHQNKIDALYQDGAEVIIYVGNSVEAVSFIRQLAIKQPPVPVISHWGITGGDFEQLAGDVLHKVDLRVLQTFSFINNKDKRARAIVDRYREKYQVNSVRDIIAPTGTAHAYDLMHLLALAIKKANSIDTDKVRDALENISVYQGLVRNYSPPFTKTDHDALDRSDFFLSRYQNGRLVPLE